MGKMDIRSEMQSSAKRQYFAGIIVNIICFCHGCTVGWVSPSLPLLTGPNTPLHAPLSATESYIVVSMTCIAATIFTPIFGWMADKFGRKTALIMTAFPYLICWVVKLAWRTATGLIIARFLSGIGGAGIFMLSPIYCVEIASLEVKGILGSLMSFSINFGIVAMYIVGAVANYEIVIAFVIPQPIIFLILMYNLPETPSFLIKNKKFKEAEKAISWLRSVPVESGIVRKEMDFLKGDMNLVRESNQQSILQIFRSSLSTRKAFVILTLLQTVQVLMGSFAVISYAEDIFNESGTSITPSTCSIILGCLLLFGSVIASSLIERLGRKVLMIGSCVIFATCMTIMAIFFYILHSGLSVEGYGMVPVVALSVAICVFAIGPGPIPYILPSEIFMLQVRGAAVSIQLAWVWFLSFIVALCFGPAVSLIGMSGVFFSFGLASISAIFLTIFCIPETRGKSVEESLAYYDKPRRILRSEMELEDAL